MKHIVVIGGGTGTYTVLKGLKKYPLHLSAIVSMTDSGGSNRILRDEFGILPTSDIRQCMVALASGKSNSLIRDLFTYRFNQGTGISGMTFGNLFMAALTDICKSQEKAIQKTCDLLDVEGEIIPVTFSHAHLVARYENGEQVLGEHYIDEPAAGLCGQRIVGLETFPPAKANPKAVKAIMEADMIILGPGDLYTSIICNLVVEDITHAILDTKAKKVFVLNLMNKFGQTQSFKAGDYLSEMKKYLSANAIDFCLVNMPAAFPQNLVRRYLQEKAEPVIDNLGGIKRPKIIRRNLVSGKIHKSQKGDKLKRSLIRHDPDKLAKAIIDLLG